VGAKPYVLLRDALTSTGQCALVKVAIRTRETLALLREKDGALVLQTMLWPDEVRSSDFAVPDDGVAIRKQEVGMAESYIATLSGDFDPSRYSSDYRQALEQLVQAKAAGLPMPEAADADEGQTADVVDLVAALRASVDAAKRRREEAAGESSEAATGTEGAAAPAPRAKRSGKSSPSSSKQGSAKRSRKTTTSKKSA
jgi:DNA end-binding protein Ku